MRILFDLGHPAHVHLFRHAIAMLVKRGHTVMVTAVDKDVTVQLLHHYGIPFVSLGSSGRCILAKALRLVVTAVKLAQVTFRFSPDLLLGVSPVRAAPVAWLLRRPCVGFDDTEHARLARRLYMPFVAAILTPSWYGAELGRTQVRYHGLHEIAYLHPGYFVPDVSALSRENITVGEPFSVVRFVSVNAVHDRRHFGFHDAMKGRLVSNLAQHGKVIICSETPLPDVLEQYRMRSPSSDVHHLLSLASVYVGDAGTMTTEAALLGTPSVFFGSVGSLIGNFRHLEEKYGLVRCFTSEEAAIECAVRFLCDPRAKQRWAQRKTRLAADCVDVTNGIVRLIETTCTDGFAFSVELAAQAMKWDGVNSREATHSRWRRTSHGEP